MPEVSAAQGSAFDLSDRAKLRIRGADRLRYLNGQISNDLRKATEDLAIHACVLNTKGRINADVFIVTDGDAFLIDTEPTLREQLAARLERYIIADDVQIEDVTEEFSLFHVMGGDAASLPENEKAVKACRFGGVGTDLWVKREVHEAALEQLTKTRALLDETEAEALRVERGVPRWGHELTEEIIPTEANLESDAIDYNKGCYIGQEVISRIKMSGQTNKRLCGLIPVAQAPLTAGMRLVSIAPEGKEVGWITSVALSPRLGKQIALGFVKRGFQTEGSQLETRGTDGAPITVEIARLPFV